MENGVEPHVNEPYQTVFATGATLGEALEALDALVIEAAKQDYIPTGGVCTVYAPPGKWYATQALVDVIFAELDEVLK